MAHSQVPQKGKCSTIFNFLPREKETQLMETTRGDYFYCGLSEDSGEKKRKEKKRNRNLLSKAALWFVRVDKDPSMGKQQQEKFLISENETVCFQEKPVIIWLFLVKKF